MKALTRATLALALFGAGCTIQTIPGPLVVSTRPLPELGAGEVKAKAVSGQSCSRVVLLFIPVGFATVESAYADAVSQAPGTDTLVNYEERNTNLFIFPFYYQVCTEVHGNAVASKPPAEKSPAGEKESAAAKEPAE